MVSQDKIRFPARILTDYAAMMITLLQRRKPGSQFAAGFGARFGSYVSNTLDPTHLTRSNLIASCIPKPSTLLHQRCRCVT